MPSLLSNLWSNQLRVGDCILRSHSEKHGCPEQRTSTHLDGNGRPGKCVIGGVFVVGRRVAWRQN
jgi:hypothetical protein